MIIDGKQIAQTIKEDIKQKIEKENLQITLAVVLVGNNPASETYVKMKRKACNALGIKSLKVILKENVTQRKLNKTLDDLSADEEVDAILLQLPLPEHLDGREAVSHIVKEKDVDGLTDANLGNLVGLREATPPCTPKGIIKLIKSVKPDISGLNATVVGRSALVGMPTALLLSKENTTVTICHSKTKNLKKHTKNADILVVAAGKENLIDKTFVKKGAIVIDVGINRNKDGKIVGDVNFASASKKAAFITPVPKGVGPMTIAMLMQNTYDLAKSRKQKK